MPPFIIWKNAYSVKVDKLDSQHKKIISIINELYSHLNKKTTNPQMLNSIIDELKDYTHTHFHDEEYLLQVSEYPEYGNHKALHEKMTQRTFDMLKASQQNWDDLSYEVLKFLKNWWINHIVDIDQKYVQYLNNKENN